MVHGGAAGGEVETLRPELGPAEIHGRIQAAPGEIRCVLAAVAEVPHAEIGVVVPDVGEQHRRAREMLEDLHRERRIRVGLGRAHNRGLRRSVGPVGIVQKGFGHIGGREMLGQLTLPLDPAEVVLELLNQIERRVIHRDLTAEQVLGEPECGIGRGPVDAPNGLLQVIQRRRDASAGRQLQLRPAHELELIDMIDVDAELLHPLRGIDDRGIDPERATSDQAVGQPAQPPRRRHRHDLRPQSREHHIVFDIAETLRERNARLVERSRIREHADEPGVLRVDIREHHDRLRAELSRDPRVLRPCPHRKVEHDRIDIRHAPAVAHRNLVLPDHVVARHHFESGRLQPADQLLAELAIHRLEGTLQVMAAVPEVEDADASLPGLKVG